MTEVDLDVPAIRLDQGPDQVARLTTLVLLSRVPVVASVRRWSLLNADAIAGNDRRPIRASATATARVHVNREESTVAVLPRDAGHFGARAVVRTLGPKAFGGLPPLGRKLDRAPAKVGGLPSTRRSQRRKRGLGACLRTRRRASDEGEGKREGERHEDRAPPGGNCSLAETTSLLVGPSQLPVRTRLPTRTRPESEPRGSKWSKRVHPRYRRRDRHGRRIGPRGPKCSRGVFPMAVPWSHQDWEQDSDQGWHQDSAM